MFGLIISNGMITCSLAKRKLAEALVRVIEFYCAGSAIAESRRIPLSANNFGVTICKSGEQRESARLATDVAANVSDRAIGTAT